MRKSARPDKHQGFRSPCLALIDAPRRAVGAPQIRLSQSVAIMRGPQFETTEHIVEIFAHSNPRAGAYS